MWWRSAVNFSFFLCLAACRMRSSACDTVPRLCARPVLCWRAFPLASALGSTGSAADRSALFVGFPATVAELTPHVRASSATAPRLPDADQAGNAPVVGRGVSRFPRRSMRACQVLRPRRVAQVLALALLDILPSTTQTASAPGISFLSRLNGWPARSPADA